LSATGVRSAGAGGQRAPGLKLCCVRAPGLKLCCVRAPPGLKLCCVRAPPGLKLCCVRAPELKLCGARVSGLK